MKIKTIATTLLIMALMTGAAFAGSNQEDATKGVPAATTVEAKVLTEEEAKELRLEMEKLGQQNGSGAKAATLVESIKATPATSK